MRSKINIYLSSIIAGLVFTSCEKMLEVEIDKSLIPYDVVFNNDITATSAVIGIYADMYNNEGFASGVPNSVTCLTGLSSDELQDEATFSPDFLQFQENTLLPVNSNILSLWKSMYFTIYQANNALEGIEQSTALTASVKQQLQGEVLFVRAFSYFYLVNLFGEVPLVISTDFETTSKQKKQPIAAIYAQIIDDLNKAKELLVDAYPLTERVRPNKAAALSLLARVYLFLENWDKAKSTATEVIDDSRYKTLPALNDAFLKTSAEAIWQLRPRGSDRNTNEGYTFNLVIGPEYFRPFALTSAQVNAFEQNDDRRLQWMDSISVDGVSWFYFPYKYKVADGGQSSNPSVPLTEYSVVLRAAELYLIRAEANAHLNELGEAINDVDKVRERAGLPKINDINPGILQQDLLKAIYSEKRSEFFTEWGHRWLDLKRTNRANDELATKPNWNTTDQLYPIPQSEIDNNPGMGDQNQGY